VFTDWAPPADAAVHFAHRLAVETDVSDVAAALGSGAFVLLDSRDAAAWAQGHVPGAVHLPGREIPARAATELDPAVPVVTYCWGPGCNGATRAALALARLGYRVRETVKASVQLTWYEQTATDVRRHHDTLSDNTGRMLSDAGRWRLRSRIEARVRSHQPAEVQQEL